MPMVDGDWSVDRATRNIRYIGFDLLAILTLR
jgi:hypothetical protein